MSQINDFIKVVIVKLDFEARWNRRHKIWCDIRFRSLQVETQDTQKNLEKFEENKNTKKLKTTESREDVGNWRQ